MAVQWSLLCLIGAVFALYKAFGRQRTHYPPGPMQIPVVGNRLPQDHLWETLKRWSGRYGPIIHFKIFSRHYVAIDDMAIATELFDKRGQLYSARPVITMNKLIGRDVSVIFSQPGDRFQMYRKMLKSWTSSDVVKAFASIQEYEVQNFITKLVESVSADKPLFHYCRRFTASIAIRLAYGDVEHEKREEFSKLGDLLYQVQNEATAPGRWLVNSFPILRLIPAWMPGTEYKRWATRAGHSITEMTQKPILMVQEELAAGRAIKSFTSHYLGEINDMGEQGIDILACAANSFFAAGTDTMAAYMNTFLFTMAASPDVQLKAREEIHKVTGGHRLPNLDDRSQLPYIDAIMLEVHRYLPVVPLLFHSPQKDDMYEGYCIPKGATVYVNCWSILHDAKEYDQPHVFMPERFLGKESFLDPMRLAFGMGRRSCPGKAIAESTTFLAVSAILATLKLHSPVRMKGDPIHFDNVTFLRGLSTSISPFKCSIEFHSDEARRLLTTVGM